MTNQLPADIAEAIEGFQNACYGLAVNGAKGFEDKENSARAALDAVILKNLRPSGTATFPCPKCGVRRGWLPACAQDGCPMLNMDGEPLGRSALADEGRGT